MSAEPTREDHFSCGLWTVGWPAAATMRTYLLLAERAAAFRADPRVQSAPAAPQVPDLATPTLSPGETLAGLVADTSAFEEPDVDTLGSRGCGIVGLDQLAVEHILGAS